MNREFSAHHQVLDLRNGTEGKPGCLPLSLENRRLGLLHSQPMQHTASDHVPCPDPCHNLCAVSPLHRCRIELDLPKVDFFYAPQLRNTNVTNHAGSLIRMRVKVSLSQDYHPLN